MPSRLLKIIILCMVWVPFAARARLIPCSCLGNTSLSRHGRLRYYIYHLPVISPPGVAAAQRPVRRLRAISACAGFDAAFPLASRVPIAVRGDNSKTICSFLLSVSWRCYLFSYIYYWVPLEIVLKKLNGTVHIFDKEVFMVYPVSITVFKTSASSEISTKLCTHQALCSR